MPVAEAYGKSKGNWISLPIAINGGYINYRIKAMNDAGFSKFPEKTDELLALCKALKAKGTPAGFALGHATGDANAWIHWLLWSHGGFLVDKDDKVIINSPETAKALEYCKALYDTFIPGTASWNDSNNNKALPLGRIVPDRERHLDLCRSEELGRCQAARHRGRHGPRLLPARAVRQAGRDFSSSSR